MLPERHYTLPEGTTPVDNSQALHRYYIRIDHSVKGFPFQIVEEQDEDKYSFYLITKPVSVSEAHSIASEFRKTGAFFMAGIQE